MTTTNNDNEPTPKCILDPSLVNASNLPMMKNVGLSVFASVCGKNRGAFVLHPSDGKTYSCLKLPENMLDLVGFKEVDDNNNDNEEEEEEKSSFQLQDANSILKEYKDGNLKASDTVGILDFLVDNFYQSSSSVATDPYACDVSGIVTLECSTPDAEESKKTPLRAVTMAGVFTPALWATGGKELTLEEASSFYTSEDFDEMKKLNLNTVQIPIPIKMFVKKDSKKADKWLDLLTDVLHQVRDADLNAILVLEEGQSAPVTAAAAIEAAAHFAQDYNAAHGTIISAFVLPMLDSALLDAATNTAPNLNVWVPIKESDVTKLADFSLAKGAALNFPHTVTVAGVASSNSQDDRGKMYYHETMACISRAPLEYSTCFQDMPVAVTTGFDLAVDDCHLQGISDSFQNYGQCERFEETIDSNWWKDHRYSFAARQLYAYERGQGWSFASWKLWNVDPQKLGLMDIPAKLLSFQDVVAAGIMPSLFDLDETIHYPLENTSPVGLACLNPPNNDFVMGDATHPPTSAPPPSCGNGWWNVTTAKCDYWIPPVTTPPTSAPTSAPCPVCSTETPLFSLLDSSNEPHKPTSNQLVRAAEVFFPGVLLSMISFFVSRRMVAGSRRRGYNQVQESNNDFQINV